MIDEREFALARKVRETDQRARQYVDSCVADALRGREPTDRNYRQFAHDVATLATTLLMRRIYEGDAELARLRDERDAWKQQAEKALRLAPPPVVLMKDK